jgi:hypothetical protein
MTFSSKASHGRVVASVVPALSCQLTFCFARTYLQDTTMIIYRHEVNLIEETQEKIMVVEKHLRRYGKRSQSLPSSAAGFATEEPCGVIT